MSRRNIIVIVALVFAMSVSSAAFAQTGSTADTAACDTARFFVENNTTPYDMALGGGGMGDNIPVFGEIPADHYADFWSFTVTDATIQATIQFDNESDGMEFALFRGMVRELDYAPLADTGFAFETDDTYTIVVRRIDVLDDTPLAYTLTLATEARGQISPPADAILRDAFTGSDLVPTLNNGQLFVGLQVATIQTHADAILSVNSQGGAGAQVYFPNATKSNPQAFSLQMDTRIQRLRFLGGDMALAGENFTYFLADFGYEVQLPLNLESVTYSDGTEIAINPELVEGVWVFESCAGLRLTDGRTFIGEIGGEARYVQLDGAPETLTLALDVPAPDESADAGIVRYQAQFNYDETRTDSEMSLSGGVFNFPLTNNRRLMLESSDVQFFTAEQMDITLTDRNITATLDWTNMATFALLRDELRVDFIDEPRASSNFVRAAANLRRVTALDDTMRLIYAHDTDSTLPGEERLLLPAAYGYIELITPQGFPEFDGRAMPDEAGYIPRGLNNTGAECYPVNTILPEANCPPNGEVNPANGNLFYAVEDMGASGGLDLSLTRSYNSRLTHIDGPFGAGWTTPYRLDYGVPFDAATASRPIAPGHSYRVGLDVTWAPRGLVTFITPSGSQHQFVSDGNTYEGGTLTAVTMPGWTLFREGVSSDTWTLTQIDGLTYVFDRAGRLLRYTDGAQTISVVYPRSSITGPDAATEGVTIQDDAGRELALTYNDNGHIVQAALTGTDGENSLVTQYLYTDAQLTGVIYPDGTAAVYGYDEAGRLIEHDDPYAPVHPRMRYAYDADGNMETISLVQQNGEALPHRLFSIIIDDESRLRRNAVTDENNNRREYVYRYTQGELRLPAETFTLASLTNPLTDVDDYENRPTFYVYENGLLIRTNNGQVSTGEGRAPVSYEYNPYGQITCIACVSPGMPPLEVDYEPLPEAPGVSPRPTQIRYANGTSETFTYDENGQIATYTDPHGANYTYEWDAGQLAATVREQDGERVDYIYNAAGQVTGVTRTLGDSAHTISYAYDWRGRISLIDDSVMGRYSVAYTDENGTTITVTDPAGVRSIYQYDRRNRLVEMSMEGDTLLALTTYTYDLYNRLTEETHWLVDDTSGIPITTTYTHERRPTLEALIAGEPATVINGAEVRVNQPGRGMYSYTFDGLDRIRRINTPFERTDYNYSIAQAAGYQFGLGIQQRTVTGGRPAIETEYIFDIRRQLREVRTGRRTWEIGFEGSTVLPASVVPSFGQRLSGLQSARWDEYANGVPTSTEVRQGDLPLRSGFSVLNDHTPSNILTLDYLNRPTSVTNATGDIINIAYCPADNGATREIYVRGTEATCTTSDFEMALRYDAGGRLIEAVDELGTRAYTYTPQSATHTWQVDVAFTGADGNSFTWGITYDGTGNLINWRDADGFEHAYSYDTLGRLTAVAVDNQPENSFTFRYNDANKVVEETDGLGRGFLYGYNELGQVISRLDKSTAEIISYAYTPNGQLETVITSDGSITSYRYEDPLNPERLTTIVEPTGSRHNFTWDDLNNTLIYSDPRNNNTSYRFDGNGLLWRIVDPLVVTGIGERMTELHYNDAGEITSWILNSRPGIAQTRYTFDRTITGEIGISEEFTGWASSLAYLPSGQLTGMGNITMSYDPLGRLTGINTDERNWTLTREDGTPAIFIVEGYTEAVELRYDSLFRRVTEMRGDDTTTINYAGDEVSIITPDGIVTRYIFSPGDSLNGTAPSVIRTGEGFRVRYLYSISGLLTEIQTQVCINEADTNLETCPSQTKSATFVYDGEGRPVRVVDENGNFEAFTYDIAGNIITYETKDGQRFNYRYDAVGRLDNITSPTGIRLFLRHNTQDRVTDICRAPLIEATDYAGCVNTQGMLENYEYDALGRMTRRVYNPGTAAEQAVDYTYSAEANGVLTAQSSPGMNFTAQYDGLGRVADIQTNGLNLTYGYDGYGRVTQADETAFAYDSQNRVMQAGTLTYDLSAALFSVADTINGQSLSYRANPRGTVRSINGSLIAVEYPAPDRVTIERADGVTIQQSLNLRGDVMSIDYENQLSIVNQANPTGYIQRQVITIPGQEQGYAIATGYDNDNRPLTMRVTDIRGLRVLYTQTFTYNASGLLLRESRRYQDRTQLLIDYEYGDAFQLVRQIVRVGQPDRGAARGLILIPGLLLLLAAAKSRSAVITRRFLLFGVIVLGFSSVPDLHAQQNPDIFSVDYIYNDAGNVESIIQTLPTDSPDSPARRVECLRFDYDGLNRLVRVRSTDLSGTESQITYSYDAFNRLTTAGDLNLTYDGERLFSIDNQSEAIYMGGTAGQPAMFAIDSNDAVTWLYSDGRERIVGATPDGEELSDIWLFDPYNRYLSLEGIGTPVDACRLSGVPDNVPELLTVQPYGDGTVWDTRSDLYFADGQAHHPAQARYVQRRTQAPDMPGYIFTPYDGDSTPPILPPESPYSSGLRILSEAQAAISFNRELTAQAVTERFAVEAQESIYPPAASLIASRAPYEESMYRLVNLPTWLQTQYNLPAPGRNSHTGALMIPDSGFPAQGGTGQATAFSPIDRLPDESTYSTGNTLYRMQEVKVPPQAFRAYEPWSLSGVEYAHTGTVPSLPIEHAPDDVLEWLPQTLDDPVDGLAALDFLSAVAEMPHTPDYAGVEQLLEESLPDNIALPPQTTDEWLENWFTEDTLGVNQHIPSTGRPDIPETYLPGVIVR